jgi:hypothetical protein
MSRSIPRSLNHHHHLADGAQLTSGHHQLGDATGLRRGNLDGGLVGHDLNHRLIFTQGVPFVYQPLDDLALDDTFTDIWEPELKRHG